MHNRSGPSRRFPVHPPLPLLNPKPPALCSPLSAGKDEGAFAWLTLNYLLGKLDSGDVAQTVAAIDLGGGSVQEAFALPEADAASTPAEYVVRLRSGGKPLSVYVHSYLGHGLMAGRAKVLDAGDKERPHACMPTGATTKYTYAGKDHPFLSTPSGDHPKCVADAVKALELGKECGAPAVRAHAGMQAGRHVRMRWCARAGVHLAACAPAAVWDRRRECHAMMGSRS